MSLRPSGRRARRRGLAAVALSLVDKAADDAPLLCECDDGRGGLAACD